MNANRLDLLAVIEEMDAMLEAEAVIELYQLHDWLLRLAAVEAGMEAL